MLKIHRVSAVSVRGMCNALIGTKDTWTPDGEYWGVFDDTRLVAFAGLKTSCLFETTVYLHCAWTLPEYRGLGLQKRLIRTRLRWAKSHKFTHAHTYTLLNNVASANALISCGFKRYWCDEPWAGRVDYWKRKL